MAKKPVFDDPDQQRELDRWECKDFSKRYEDTSDFVSHKTLFIICGCGRSGTSLLRVMCEHILSSADHGRFDSWVFVDLADNPNQLAEYIPQQL
jgi:hypothetical protein